MAQATSRSASFLSGSSHDDPLDEVREAVRADRQKIACVPVAGLALRASPERGYRLDGRRRRVTR